MISKTCFSAITTTLKNIEHTSNELCHVLSIGEIPYDEYESTIIDAIIDEIQMEIDKTENKNVDFGDLFIQWFDSFSNKDNYQTPEEFYDSIKETYNI